MDTLPAIIEKLGGVTAIANATGIPLTTVHGWKRSGFVPRWRVPTLVELAARLGVTVAATDFPSRRGRLSAEAPADHDGFVTGAAAASSSGKGDDVAAKQVAA